MQKVRVKAGAPGYFLKDVLVSLSAANLALLGVWDQLIYAGRENLYYLPNFTWYSYFAAMILMFFLAAVFLTALGKLRTAGAADVSRFFAVAALVAFIPLIAYAVRLVFGWPVAWIVKEMSDPFNAVLVLIAFTAALLVVWKWRRPLALSAYIVLMVFSPWALLNVVHAGHEAVLAMADENPVVVGEVHEPPTKKKTILMIFDELDYRMTFEEKVPGLELENFNELKQSSLFFTNVASISGGTYSAIPLLTTGRRVAPFYMGDDDLGIEFKDSGDKSTWRSVETLFSQFVEAGKNVALIGWHHPYCRIFGGMVAYCKNYFLGAVETYSSGSLHTSLLKQAAVLTPFYKVLNAIETYKNMEEDLYEVLNARSAIDFIYVHFTVPHSPYIYDRESEKLTLFNVVDGYIDNLLLTDILLGRLIGRMKEEGLWDTSTLIVTGDHHWRNPSEYDGVNSLKVPLLVKLPKQDKMRVSDVELSLLDLKPMIEKIVFAGILDPADLAREFETTQDAR